MDGEIIRDFAWALLGAVIAGGLQARLMLSEGRSVHLLRAAVIVAGSSLFTSFYFRLSPGDYKPLAPFQYAIFVVLLIEEVINYFGTQTNPATQVHVARPRPAPGGMANRVAVIPGLILNGWVSVLAVGCFGALLAELHRIRGKRDKRAMWPVGWMWSIVVVLTSGLVTLLHGIEHVNALTAVQLGAAGPLVASRLRV